ncbi:hypothetical protein FXO38_33563 [Capsicum annuum]|uniref:uncharacterized protein LOC107872005 n=1 Tax=Capsicum annuum TaxID=4072 RepID=UPI001FB0F715|nr:uncharacterized protein LOC107872005 [Capsicum annuum]KAF3618213.1 hypothetical protein FXO38_33563 [Capsicum annuum]
MERTKICLKLLVDGKAHKVVFAEAGKDFIDFIFNILTLPIGYCIGQPSTKSVFGSLGNIIPILNSAGSNYMQLNELGNVQEIMAWIVTDNLFIAPSSAASVISVLKRCKAQVDQLQYKAIDFQISDLEQEFLQVSLKSKTVLTDLFLRQTGWRKTKNGEKCNVTLIIDTKADRVIFAEVGKDLFCFLIRLLQLPIATVINQTKTNGVGCIGNVYRSFKNLNESYIQSNQTKDELLMATVSNSWFEALQLFHDTPNKLLDRDIGGYVKGLVEYMVTDDLSITPLSLISVMSRLNICNNAESTTKLEVKTVEFGVNEALRFLEASFRSERVLSEVFLVRDELDVVVVA